MKRADSAMPRPLRTTVGEPVTVRGKTLWIQSGFCVGVRNIFIDLDAFLLALQLILMAVARFFGCRSGLS